MENLPEISNMTLIASMCVIFILGGIWVALRVIFKLAMRVFVLGCAGILLLGGLIYLVSSSLTLP